MTASCLAIPLVDARDESEFGGKAVQLGEAIRAGLPVPSGVALRTELAAAVARHEPAAAIALSDIFGSLRPPLAARSSCVGEDSAGASFAGQHHTTLGVKTIETLRDAIDVVWRSAQSDAARAYREKLGLSKAPKMAVIIQELIESEVAGVMFTRNPVSGADERVIEAAWGLGEVVVQGLLTPDTYRISRDGEVLERIAGHKDRALQYQAAGSTAFESVSPDLCHAFCLDDGQLSLLHDLARRCEESFEGPSDIEWAFAEGDVFLLQRRPITTTLPR